MPQKDFYLQAAAQMVRQEVEQGKNTQLILFISCGVICGTPIDPDTEFKTEDGEPKYHLVQGIVQAAEGLARSSSTEGSQDFSEGIPIILKNALLWRGENEPNVNSYSYSIDCLLVFPDDVKAVAAGELRPGGSEFQIG